MEQVTDNLPFWHFFHELEKQLSYERWTDKYKLFLGQLYGEGYLDSAENPEKLLQLCKALYLQDLRDEPRFENLFLDAWQKEKKYWENTFRELIEKKQRKEKESLETATPSNNSTKNNKDNKLTGAENKTKNTPNPKPTEIAETNTSTKEYYYNPPEIPTLRVNQPIQSNDVKGGFKRVYNFQDDYLSITRREMNKAWQYLRHSEKGSPTNIVNIPATINKLAKETIFTEPVFISGKRNRDDTLILFIDCNGSMVPFHELSRRMVSSAKAFGGHRNAQVFYFQNYPLGYVFGSPNLTKPHKTIEAFTKANKQFTTAVIISDAGFARSYGNDERYTTRLTCLEPFFKMLAGHCAHTLWLNPMPENRWQKQTAEKIQMKVLKMAPVLEKGMNTFQNILRNLVKVNPSSIIYDKTAR